MPLPKTDEYFVPLLLELERVGGSARPSEIYERVLSHFPPDYISNFDLRERQGSGREGRYKNLIQNARQQLKKRGAIEARSDGSWPITSLGRQGLRDRLIEKHGVSPADVDRVISGRARLYEIHPSWKPAAAGRPRIVRRGPRKPREVIPPPSPPEPLPKAPSLSSLIAEHLGRLRDQLMGLIVGLSADQFEELVAEFLRRMGYSEVRHVGGPGDRNIDVTGAYLPPFVRVPVRVQVKHRQPGGTVGPSDVAAFRDRAGGIDRVLLVVSNGRFTDAAVDTANEEGRQQVHLANGEQLLTAAIHSRIGVKEGPMGILEIDEEFWGRF